MIARLRQASSMSIDSVELSVTCSICVGARALPPPSWREVFDSPDVLNFLEQERLPGLHPRMEALMARAAGRGWLAYSDEPRSLRVGPTYLASPGQKKLRVRQPRDMGRRVAGAVARFRYKHKHNPTIKEFADFLRNARVQRIFRGEADVLKSLPWLVVSGWIVLEDGRVLRGSDCEGRHERTSGFAAFGHTRGRPGRQHGRGAHLVDGNPDTLWLMSRSLIVDDL